MKNIFGYNFNGKAITVIFKNIKMRFIHGLGVEQILLKDYERISYFRPKKGDIVIDVGAFVGLYSLYAATLVKPNGVVIAVEPNPINRAYLSENIELNEEKIRIDHAAMGSFKGIVRFEIDENMPTSTSKLFINNARSLKKTIKCDIDTLDNLLTSLHFEHVDLVKIDVEGAELDVLQGAIKSMQNRIIKKFIVEIHTWIINRDLKNIISLLESNNYIIEGYIDGILYTQIAY